MARDRGMPCAVHRLDASWMFMRKGLTKTDARADDNVELMRPQQPTSDYTLHSCVPRPPC